MGNLCIFFLEHLTFDFSYLKWTVKKGYIIKDVFSCPFWVVPYLVDPILFIHPLIGHFTYCTHYSNTWTQSKFITLYLPGIEPRTSWFRAQRFNHLTTGGTCSFHSLMLYLNLCAESAFKVFSSAFPTMHIYTPLEVYCSAFLWAE
jgi:hypothetical protein